MIYRIAADTVLLLHLAFIVFVLLGGLLVIKWRWLPWLHLPAAAWGVVVEFTAGICPLTRVEHALRARAGQNGYDGGFIEHYIVKLIYPSELTPQWQIMLAGVVIVINAYIYARLWIYDDTNLNSTRTDAPDKSDAKNEAN